MGIAGYICPELAAGQTVDKRAEIWSFGVVLWEMLSGQPAFQFWPYGLRNVVRHFPPAVL
jgi:serine/threonine protein kinase